MSNLIEPHACLCMRAIIFFELAISKSHGLACIEFIGQFTFFTAINKFAFGGIQLYYPTSTNRLCNSN